MPARYLLQLSVGNKEILSTGLLLQFLVVLIAWLVPVKTCLSKAQRQDLW